jgi:alpha-methylacyl-CoA racemase
MKLDEFKVLDLCRLGPGSYTTQLLADLHADVLKIEPPSSNEREISSNSFSVFNRNKQSLCLNLKRKEGQEILLDLVEESDILIEQFRPGVMNELGLDFQTLKNYNDELIYCSLSGYGQESSERQRVGHDLNYAAYGGLVDMNRKDKSSAPVIPGYPIADMATGIFAAFSITSALVFRESTDINQPQHIDLAITDVVVSLSQNLSGAIGNENDPRPGNTLLTGKYPCYNIYETSDGKYISLAALEPKFWENLCKNIGRSDLINNHMSAQKSVRQSTKQELVEIFGSKSRSEWENKLHDKDVMFSPVLTPSEVFKSEYADQRGLIYRGNNLAPRVGLPVKTNIDTKIEDSPAPDLGEHTTEILSDLGIPERIIDELVRDGVVEY